MPQLYEFFKNQIGPLNKFITKNVMWNEIATILNKQFDKNATGIQMKIDPNSIIKEKNCS